MLGHLLNLSEPYSAHRRTESVMAPVSHNVAMTFRWGNVYKALGISPGRHLFASHFSYKRGKFQTLSWALEESQHLLWQRQSYKTFLRRVGRGTPGHRTGARTLLNSHCPQWQYPYWPSSHLTPDYHRNPLKNQMLSLFSHRLPRSTHSKWTPGILSKEGFFHPVLSTVLPGGCIPPTSLWPAAQGCLPQTPSLHSPVACSTAYGRDHLSSRLRAPSRADIVSLVFTAPV